MMIKQMEMLMNEYCEERKEGFERKINKQMSNN